MLRGYQQFDGEGACRVLVSVSVFAFLEKHNENDRQHVLKIGQILAKVGELGSQMPRNSKQFRREGRFPSGSRGGGEIAVYAVKAHHLRVYGGFMNVRGVFSFLCVEAAKKKKDKADQAQLKRVAKELGAQDGRH